MDWVSSNSEEREVGEVMPKPPSLAGNPKSYCSSSLGGALYVKAGINFILIISSRDCK